jgi:uncharacterized membrane protein HdeD (DUF308 family)
MADKFCIYCGANLEEGATFCPQCGANVTREEGQQPYQPQHVQQAPDKLGSLGTLILLYGFLAIILGVFCLAVWGAIDTIWDMIMEDEASRKLIENYDKETIALSMLMGGITMLASGACAIISGIKVNARENYNLALITCILATVLSFSFLITLIVGIVVVVKLVSGKDSFKS